MRLDSGHRSFSVRNAFNGCCQRTASPPPTRVCVVIVSHLCNEVMTIHALIHHEVMGIWLTL